MRVLSVEFPRGGTSMKLAKISIGLLISAACALTGCGGMTSGGMTSGGMTGGGMAGFTFGGRMN